MTSNWRRDRLPEIVREMASRPAQGAGKGRHEPLRIALTELLRDGFDAAFSEIEHERYLIDNSGRVDVAWGEAIIELKSDLRREERDVVARMPDYLADAAARSPPGRSPVGLATDGATFLAYTLEEGALSSIGRFDVDPGRPERLLTGLQAGRLATLPPIHKDPFDRLTVAQALAEGVAFVTADAVLADYPGQIVVV